MPFRLERTRGQTRRGGVEYFIHSRRHNKKKYYSKIKRGKAVDIRLGVVPETESRLLQCIVHCVCHGDSGSRRAYLKRFID
jgi:hypothetical protein